MNANINKFGRLRKIEGLRTSDLEGKVVLLRVDHNVVEDGKIKDPFRIDQSIPTIRYLMERKARLVIASHNGRPYDKKVGFIRRDSKNSLLPVVNYLNEKGIPTVSLPDENEAEIRGWDDVQRDQLETLFCLAQQSNPGSKVYYLPNTRFFWGEEGQSEQNEFLNFLSRKIDIHVNDAFASWQPHVSTFQVPARLKQQKRNVYAGLLLAQEVESISSLFDVELPRPFVAVVAGSKFDTKIGVLNKLLAIADHVILGGVINNAYLAATYNLIPPGLSDDQMKQAHDFLSSSQEYAEKIIAPNSIVVGDERGGSSNLKKLKVDFAYSKETKYLNGNWSDIGDYDPNVGELIANAGTIFVNAVMGHFPYFTQGTDKLYRMIIENKAARKIFGGGDTLDALKQLYPDFYEQAMIGEQNAYLSTGGGATLQAVESGSPYEMDIVKVLCK